MLLGEIGQRTSARVEDAARFALAPPLRPPDAARRRRLQLTQLSTNVTECRSGAYVREKHVYFTFASLQRQLLSADFCLGQSISHL